MGKVNLPEGWAQTVISDIADVNPKKIEAEPEALSGFVPMSHAPTDFNGTLSFEEKPWGEIKKSYTNFQDHDVIVAKVTPCFENGKAAIVQGLPNGIGAGSSEFYILRPAIKEVSTRFLFSIVKSHKFLQEGAANMTGAVGLRRVPRAFVETFPVSLPPLAEQKVVANKLDTLLAQVETSKARLDRIPQILKTFRRSVLAAAVSGKLTENWRKVNEGTPVEKTIKSIKEARQQVVSGRDKNAKPHLSEEEYNIPITWQWVSLDSISRKITDGAHHTPQYTESGVNFISVKDIRNGKIDFSNTRYISSEEHQELSKRCPVEFGDLLITKSGTIGRTAIVKTEQEFSLFVSVALIKPANDEVNTKFIDIALQKWVNEIDISSRIVGSAIKNLHLRDMKVLAIPFAPKEEQTQIVHRVEELFAFAERIEQKANAALEHVNNLTQSILAKAFRGELTADWRAQNPDLISGDNSAEALLEKIKAEREALSSKKKPKKKIAARKKA